MMRCLSDDLLHRKFENHHHRASFLARCFLQQMAPEFAVQITPAPFFDNFNSPTRCFVKCEVYSVEIGAKYVAVVVQIVCSL